MGQFDFTSDITGSIKLHDHVASTSAHPALLITSEIAQAFKAEYNITTDDLATYVHGVKVELTRAADIQPSNGCWFGGQFVLNAGSSGYTALDKPAYVLQAIFKGSDTSPNGTDIHVGRFETQSAGKVSDIVHILANTGTTITGSLEYIAAHVAPSVSMVNLNAQSSITVPTGIKIMSGSGSSYNYGIDLASATINTADIRFHHGTTLLDDGTDLTLAGANLVLGEDLIPSTDDSKYLGSSTLGWKGIHFPNTLIKELSSSFLEFRNNADTFNRSISVSHIWFSGSLTARSNASAMTAYAAEDGYTNFAAYDTEVEGSVVVGKLQGASDPYFGLGGSAEAKFYNSGLIEIGAFTLGGKLTGGANEIEGSAFDINGGTIDGVTITQPNLNEAVALTATATELNLLDLASLTAGELLVATGATAAAWQSDGVVLSDPYVDDIIFIGNSNTTIDATAWGTMAVGVQIDQGATSGALPPVMQFLSTDVAHGMTTLAGTSVWGIIRKANALGGGLTIHGLTDSDGVGGQAFVFLGTLGEAPDTTKSTAARSVVEINTWKKSGTSHVATAGADNIFSIHAGSVAQFVFGANGYLWMSGGLTLGGTLAMGGYAIDSANYLELDEITTPSALADHAKIYTKSDDHFYFQDGGGTENVVAIRGHHNGEMYINAGAVVTNIQGANDWHLLKGFTAGVESDFTHTAGKQLTITAYADNLDSKTKVTVAGHGLSNDDAVSISGTTSYDGIWVIEQVDTNDFVINRTFVADDGASVGEHGDHLVVGTGAVMAGTYMANFNLTVTPSNPNDVLEFALVINGTLCIKCHSQTKTGAVNDYQTVSSGSIVALSAGDHFHVAGRNLAGANDFTIKHANVRIIQG